MALSHLAKQDATGSIYGDFTKDTGYKSFVLDGQSVIIEDYLEVRPENKEKVVKYIKDGRISIGHWYTLPDLYPNETYLRRNIYLIFFCGGG